MGKEDTSKKQEDMLTEQTKKKQTSIYHVRGVFIEKTEDIKGISPWKIDSENGIGGYGFSILKVLTRYSMLNKACILKSVQSVKPTEWKRRMISKTLKALRKAKMIQMFQMDGNADGDASLVIYCISEKGEEFLKENKIESSEGFIARDLLSCKGAVTNEEKEDITYECMRILALNQWHINMLYILGNNIKASYFRSFKTKNVTVPSMITYVPYKAKTGIKSQDKKNAISVFSFYAPNNDASIEILANQLVETYEFLIDPEHKNYRPSVIIILCENTNHTAWVTWKINQFRQLRPLDAVLYAIDITTSKERMLALLNECRADELGIVRTGINLE